MALFVVRHQHTAEDCPAKDPYAGAGLLNYLSRPNVSQHGVRIHGEAVVQGEHTVYFIVDADDEAGLRVFLQPFQQAGTVDIYPASTCAGVVASGGCAAPPVSSIIGVRPPKVVSDVRRMARKRSRAAAATASAIDRPAAIWRFTP